MKTRILYIEHKPGGDDGGARIGRITLSKTGRSIWYRGKNLLKAKGIFGNYIHAETRDEYWVSGCKRNGEDRLFSGVVEIDDDVREEYWTSIRRMPAERLKKRFTSPGKARR